MITAPPPFYDPRKNVEIEGLAKLFTDYPLFRQLVTNLARSGPFVGRRRGGGPDINYARIAIPSVSQHCHHEACKMSPALIWNPDVSVLEYTLQPFAIAQINYKCRNCNTVRNYFLILQYADEKETLSVLKAGQWPPPHREPDRNIVCAWRKDDVLFYREAITLRNAGKGIGAMPYLRRIIERHIDDILEHLLEEHKARAITGVDPAEIQALVGAPRFKDKVNALRPYIDRYSVEGVGNPIEIFHGLLSDGLHNQSEEHCLDLFDRVNGAFVYVVTSLNEERDKRREFIQSMKAVVKPR